MLPRAYVVALTLLLSSGIMTASENDKCHYDCMIRRAEKRPAAFVALDFFAHQGNHGAFQQVCFSNPTNLRGAFFYQPGIKLMHTIYKKDSLGAVIAAFNQARRWAHSSHPANTDEHPLFVAARTGDTAIVRIVLLHKDAHINNEFLKQARKLALDNGKPGTARVIREAIVSRG